MQRSCSCSEQQCVTLLQRFDANKASCHSAVAHLRCGLSQDESLVINGITCVERSFKLLFFESLSSVGNLSTAPRTPDAIEAPASHLLRAATPKGSTRLIRQPSMAAA